MLVFKQDVEPNTLITLDLFTTKKEENPGKSVFSSEEMNQIIGLETCQFVPEGEPLYERYFQQTQLAIGENTGTFILSLPDHWLQAYPQTLRRGDRAFFYCKGELVTDAVVAHVRDGRNQEICSQGEERVSPEALVNLIEVVVTEEQASLLAGLAEKGNQFLLLYY